MLLLLLGVGLTLGVELYADETLVDRTVVYLPQRHSFMGMHNDSEALRIVAYSQWMIVDFLRRQQNYILYWEGTYETELSERIPQSVRRETRSIFPNGLPPDFRTLAPHQVRYLATHGGKNVALALGHLNRVERSDSEALVAEARRLMSDSEISREVTILETDDRIREIVKALREEYLFQQISLHSSDERQIIVVYGLGHDFQDIGGVSKHLSIRIPDAFLEFMCRERIKFNLKPLLRSAS